MRALLQRVSSGSVSFDKENRSISKGLVVLLGISSEDGENQIDWMIEKILRLRIFPTDWDENFSSDKKFSEFGLSIEDLGGEILLVPQFTLYGNVKKGRRPDFSKACPPSLAKPLYEAFVTKLKRRYSSVQTGGFGAMMKVVIHNEGPVTLLIDTEGNV